MKKTSSEEKVTIQGAAKALGVSRGTVVHYLNNGRLTRIKEGSKVYILMDEIRILRDQKKDPNVTRSAGGARGSDGITVTVDREYYEELLGRLGQLELEKQHLLKYKDSMVDTKAALSNKEMDLQKAKAKLLMMEEELRRIKKMNWWRRLFGRGWRMTGG